MTDHRQNPPPDPQPRPDCTDPVRRREYLEKLRAEIEQQTYHISAEEIAERIMEFEKIK